MANSKSTDFLRFSAYSIRDVIIRKLSESSEFTDQIYEGSNLNILIDLVSYMYQCLVFQLNSAASESMFADTQIFENIVRLVSLLGYQAKGCTPSAIQTFLTYNGTSPDPAFILPYTRFNTGLTDSNGKAIYFSTAKGNSVDNETVGQIESGKTKKVTFVNGQYKMYSTVFTASGDGNDTFILEGLKSDAADQKYVAQNYIDVYVEHDRNAPLEYWNYDAYGIFTKSKNLDKLTVENSFYGTGSNGNEDKVYTVSLNQDKTYEIRFGDGIIGKKLEAGDRVIVMYLDTNGPDGEVDIADIDFGAVKLEHSPQVFSMSTNDNPSPGEVYGLYERMFCASSDGIDLSMKNASIADASLKDMYELNVEATASSKFKAEESVEDIRQNAPNWFKTGNRLITKQDYEYFIKNNSRVQSAFNNQPVAEVKCMNNIEYTATFYKWLYLQGKLNRTKPDPRHYFDPVFFNRNDYAYVDPADANNTYLWVRTANSDVSEAYDTYDVGTAESSLNNQLKAIKTMTTEIKVVKPVYVNFEICARPIGSDGELKTLKDDYFYNKSGNFDENCDSYIEVTLDDNTLYVSTSIQSSIKKIILDEFSMSNCHFGQAINYDKMLSKIYNISGIRNIRTVYARDGELIRAYDGLSFASWSPLLDDVGESDSEKDVAVDLAVGNSIRTLEPFQFPVFRGRSLLDKRIRLIKKSMTSINTIKM